MVTGQSVVPDTDSSAIALPAVVDLDAIDPLRDVLLDALAGGPVSVSGAAVERVSTNGVLMLLSAAEAARRNDTGFRLVEPSAALQAAIGRLGLEPHFAALIEG